VKILEIKMKTVTQDPVVKKQLLVENLDYQTLQWLIQSKNIDEPYDELVLLLIKNLDPVKPISNIFLEFEGRRLQENETFLELFQWVELTSFRAEEATTAPAVLVRRFVHCLPPDYQSYI